VVFLHRAKSLQPFEVRRCCAIAARSSATDKRWLFFSSVAQIAGRRAMQLAGVVEHWRRRGASELVRRPLLYTAQSLSLLL
jgi:hypothetical protein